MYIKENLVRFLKIKNVILSFISVFLIAVSAAIIVSLTVYYWGDWETVITAKATPESVLGLFIGVVLFVYAFLSKKMIGDAYFYSSYFEGDLYGNITYNDLESITGKNISSIKAQLHFFRIIYMKNYSFKTINGEQQIELYSKKFTCECRNCGATIEKSEYFTGECSYCHSSDLFAKVLTANRFYSISNEITSKRNKEYYSKKNLLNRKALFLIGLCIGLTIFLIVFFAFTEQIEHYSDKEYLTEVLMSGISYSSYELIKAEILDNIIWIIYLMLTIVPLICAMAHRLKDILITENCAEYFSSCKTPFIKATNLPAFNKKHGIKSVKGAICRHYLLNCSFVKHENVLKVALARKIVKDQCPSCGAPIVGAVDENYKCKYCGNIIMDVIRSK